MIREVRGKEQYGAAINKKIRGIRGRCDAC